MSLSQTEAKYINIVLAELYARAMEYARLSRANTKSSRDRAVWKALAIETARSYNFALKTLGLVGSSKLAQAQELLLDTISGKLMDSLTETEVETLIVEAYGVYALERKRVKHEEQQKVMELVLKHSDVAKAVLTLKEHAPQKNTEAQAKGGIVRHLVQQGVDKTTANSLAEEQLTETAIEQRIESIDQDEAIATALREQGIEPAKDKFDKLGKEMLDLI